MRLYTSKYFKIYDNNQNSALSISVSYFKYNNNEFNLKFLNLPHTIQIRLLNVNRRFFYGFVNYIYKYEVFKVSAFIFFIYLIYNVRKIIVKKKQSLKTGKKAEISKNNDLLVIEINSRFLEQFLRIYNDNLSSYNSSSKNILEDMSYVRLVRSFKIVGVNLIEHDEIIRAWSSLVLSWLNKKVKYEGYWAFFSTLGGAYSSLGEESYEHAINAEKTSLRQLNLAISFNDPNSICRCKLFLSFSFIQLGKYQQANYILKNEYKILKNEIDSKRIGITDDRLKVMCIAGLKKLRFCISMKKSSNSK